MRVSVLIPYYSPAPSVPELTRRLSPILAAAASAEVDSEVLLSLHHPAPTAAIAAALPMVRLVHERFDPSRERAGTRAAALNAAAAQAAGEVYVLLHADILLPPGALAEIVAARRAGHRWGAFWKAYDRTTPLLRVQEWWLNRWQLQVKGRPVGTNVVWLDRGLWESLPEVRMLEDFALTDRLRRDSRPYLSRRSVTVSAEKYLRTGVARSIAINATVLALHQRLRVHPDRLDDAIYSRRELASGPVSFWTSLCGAASRCVSPANRRR